MSDQLRMAYLRLPTSTGTLVLMYDLTPAPIPGSYITQRHAKCPKCRKDTQECRDFGEVTQEHGDRMTTLPLVRLWCAECERFL